MRHLDLQSPLPTSACAAVALSCQAEPEFLVTANRGNGLTAARWRSHQASLPVPQSFSDHLLWYCPEGVADGTMQVDGVASRMQIRPESVGFVPAGQAVQWMLRSPTEFVFVNLYIPCHGTHTQMPPSRIPGSVRLATRHHDGWVRSYFQLLMAEYEQCMRDDRIEASPFLDETEGLLMRHLESMLPKHAAPSVCRTPDALCVAPLRPFILRRIEAFVDSSLESAMRLESLAELASMSTGHFVRAFRRATGFTPHQYILERRLDKACSQLRESTERVSVVAKRCGFGNAAHFSTMFHARRGCSPSDFRQRL